MAYPISSHGSMCPQSQPAPRFPKLSYRTKCSDAESIKTVSTDASRMTTSTNLTSPMQSSFCPSPREPSVDMMGALSPRASSFAPSSIAPRYTKHQPKKRPSFFAGLFGTKEPSAQALAEYQKQLQKSARGRTSAIGIPGVSSAKLPPTVPKVNSKWDGIPETHKEKDKQRQESRQSKLEHIRGHSAARSVGSEVRSTSTSASQNRRSRGTLDGMSTYSNGGSTNRLAELYGWEADSIPILSSSSAIVDFAAEHRPMSSRLQTSHSAPAPSEKPPPLDRAFLFPPHATSQLSPSKEPHFGQPSPSPTSSPALPGHSDSPTLTPVESSPITPGTPPPKMDFASTPRIASSHAKLCQLDNLKTTVLEVPTAGDEIIVKSAGPNILGPPATAKRAYKASPYQSTEDRPKTSGLDMPLTSILKKEHVKESYPYPVPGSYFPSTGPNAPSTPVRRNSARDRLGLGMSLKNQAVAPWSSPANAGQAGIGGEGNTRPVPDGEISTRKRRMSLFRK